MKQSETLGIDQLLEKQGEPDPKDQTISSLEGTIEDLKDKHYEERFIWILVCVILADAFIFPTSPIGPPHS